MSTLCHICLKSPATSHLSEIGTDGLVTELHICSGCCDSLQLDLPTTPMEITKILKKAAALDNDAPLSDIDDDRDISISDLEDEDNAANLTGPQGLHCDNCGMSFEQFSNNNRFGCAHDYDSFSDALIDILEDLHGHSQHCGRGPQHNDDYDINLETAHHRRAQRSAKLQGLEKNLKQSIAEERYEEAAALRDQIKDLDQ